MAPPPATTESFCNSCEKILNERGKIEGAEVGGNKRKRKRARGGEKEIDFISKGLQILELHIFYLVL